MKTIFLFTAVLAAVMVAIVLASGSFERLIRPFVTDPSSAVSVVRNKMPPPDISPAAGGSGKKPGPTEPMTGVTRSYIKPPDTEPTEAARLEISAVEQNNELLLSGKLLDGSACHRLQIDLQLEADDGRKIYHTLILDRTEQTGERPIRSKRRLSPSSVRTPVIWKSHVAALRCLDP